MLKYNNIFHQVKYIKKDQKITQPCKKAKKCKETYKFYVSNVLKKFIKVKVTKNIK